MNRFAAIASLASGVLLTACGDAQNPSTTPCTTCINVAGTYTETSTEKEMACPDNSKLLWGGGTFTIALTQDGSSLTATQDGRTLNGTLHDDNSVAFEPVAAVARGVNGAPDAPGKLYFVGQFTDGTPPTFAGTHTFVKDSDRCTIKVVVAWDRKE